MGIISMGRGCKLSLDLVFDFEESFSLFLGGKDDDEEERNKY